MGTHTNGPAHLYDSPETPLLSLISSDPTFYLGETLVRKWPSSTHIPYLFKVLSIKKALPLQAHPDKDLAMQLQLKDPSNFVDSNHKPEIAVAIGDPIRNTWSRAMKGQGDGQVVVGDADTAFTGFVGFRPLEEIRGFLQTLPELGEAIGDDQLVSSFVQNPSKDLLRQIFGELLKRGVEAREEVAKTISQLQDRIEQNGGNLGFHNSEELAKLVLKVNEQYPGDAGVLATTFFMNFAKLRKGEAVYIGADEVHAYLEGGECPIYRGNLPC